MRSLLLLTFSLLCTSFLHAVSIEGRVIAVDSVERLYTVELTESDSKDLKTGAAHEFKVGPGDAGIDYSGRLIRAKAAEYGGRWNLEQVFPLGGPGAKSVADVNRMLRTETATMSRRKFVRQGDNLPNFGMIDQRGDFMQIRELQGRAFVMNFIFTRCQVPTMCPASSTRMSELQDQAREEGLDKLHFVTITFDPAFDSPGILAQYAEGYEIEQENFHLLTNADTQVIEDLLRQFGILTMEEDGTINHTMATLLVDKNGRVAFRKEGSKWTVNEFLKEARKLR
ncbi:MAG: SCO family protein [Coraliomargarita sp.]